MHVPDDIIVGNMRRAEIISLSRVHNLQNNSKANGLGAKFQMNTATEDEQEFLIEQELGVIRFGEQRRLNPVPNEQKDRSDNRLGRFKSKRATRGFSVR
ncbi:hypothetical protein MRB53_023568 [Persea americana]|uniref:Uncharacterized protein n=1 Tax=Persea americana TaxID=3435 RepID=A0ACC2LAH1_PERAE|nr:hypothetical protein MRB53_023568 [Persea americana]